jgi:hypothetical protein
VSAARRVISGVDDVSRYVVGVTSGRFGDLSIVPVLVNGDFGWHVRRTPRRPEDGWQSVLTVAVREGRIVAFYNVAAPDKLAPAGLWPADRSRS